MRLYMPVTHRKSCSGFSANHTETCQQCQFVRYKCHDDGVTQDHDAIQALIKRFKRGLKMNGIKL